LGIRGCTSERPAHGGEHTAGALSAWQGQSDRRAIGHFMLGDENRWLTHHFIDMLSIFDDNLPIDGCHNQLGHVGLLPSAFVTAQSSIAFGAASAVARYCNLARFSAVLLSWHPSAWRQG
jgi:hypothetical protein